MYKICDKVMNFIMKAMENWKTEFAVGRQTLAEVKIQRTICQRYSLSPPLFVIAMTPLNYVQTKTKVNGPVS